jgi:hypothetical protein
MDPASDWVASGGKLALDLDGSNDYVDTKLKIGTGDVSVSWWMRPSTAFNSGAVRLIWSHFSAGTPQFSAEVFTDNRWYVGWNNPGADQRVIFNATSENYPLNTWVHCVLTCRSSSISTFFQNGISIATNGGTTTTSTAPTGFFWIGKSDTAPARFFTGLIDDFTIYNAALTANEVREIYRLGRGYGVFPEPDFDEGFAAAGFKAYWARRQSQLIGGGV